MDNQTEPVATDSRRLTYRDHINPMRDELYKRFPAVFHGRGTIKRVPLMIGVRQAILARCPDLDPLVVEVTLRDYTGTRKYLSQMTSGAIRFDLDGAANGTVTPSEAAYSRNRLAALDRKGKPAT